MTILFPLETTHGQVIQYINLKLTLISSNGNPQLYRIRVV